MYRLVIYKIDYNIIKLKLENENNTFKKRKLLNKLRIKLNYLVAKTLYYSRKNYYPRRNYLLGYQKIYREQIYNKLNSNREKNIYRHKYNIIKRKINKLRNSFCKNYKKLKRNLNIKKYLFYKKWGNKRFLDSNTIRSYRKNRNYYRYKK